MARRISPKTEAKKSVSLLPRSKVYCTYHPDAVLMGGFQFEARITEDFYRFNQRRLEPPGARLPVASASCVGFDTEYDPNQQLLTVGIADADCAAAIETTEAGWKKTLQPIIKKAKVLCGHSVGGDLDYLVRLGLARDSWLAGRDLRDSFLLARMQDENRGKGAYGLEALLLSEFNFTQWKAATDKLIKATGNAADWTPEQRVARCRLDAWATRVLAEHFERKINEKRRAE